MTTPRLILTLLTVLSVGWFATPAQSRNVVVFGDSLSGYADAWPDQMVTNMRNHAQGGLTLRDFEVPSWLGCSNKRYRSDEVILWLGTNDATQGIPSHVFSAKLREVLSVLRVRGCTVYLALVPEWTDHPVVAHRLEKYRQVQRDVARLFRNVEVFEIPYDRDMLIDLIHPNLAQSYIQAHFVELFLGERQ